MAAKKNFWIRFKTIRSKNNSWQKSPNSPNSVRSLGPGGSNVHTIKLIWTVLSISKKCFYLSVKFNRPLNAVGSGKRYFWNAQHDPFKMCNCSTAACGTCRARFGMMQRKLRTNLFYKEGCQRTAWSPDNPRCCVSRTHIYIIHAAWPCTLLLYRNDMVKCICGGCRCFFGVKSI